MSGLEVAGVVLAAFPVGCHLITQYLAVTSSVNKAKRWRAELRTCHNRLRHHHRALRTIMEKALIDVVPDEQIQQMIVNLRHELWRKREFARAFESKHGEIYQDFLAALSTLEADLQNLFVKIGLGGAENVRTIPLTMKSLVTVLNMCRHLYHRYVLRFQSQHPESMTADT